MADQLLVHWDDLQEHGGEPLGYVDLEEAALAAAPPLTAIGEAIATLAQGRDGTAALEEAGYRTMPGGREDGQRTVHVPVADDLPTVLVEWADGVPAALYLMEAKKVYDKARHPRWPRGTPRAGQFMKVGQRFEWKGKEYEVAMSLNGKIVANVATGKIADAKTVEIKGDLDDDGDGLHISGVTAAKPKNLTGGKANSNVTVVDPYVDHASHDPSLKIPATAPPEMTPERWKRFGKLDQEHYLDLMERFGSWKPTAAQKMSDKGYKDFDKTLQDLIQASYHSQYSESSGSSISLVNLADGSKAGQEHRERAKELQLELGSIVQWDLYNRTAAPDLTTIHKDSNSRDASWWSTYTSGAKPIFSGLSQSFHFRRNFFGTTGIVHPLAIRHITMSSLSAHPLPNKKTMMDGELEISIPDQLKLDPKRSFHIAVPGQENAITEVQTKWLEGVTKTPQGGEVIEQFQQALKGQIILDTPAAAADIKVQGVKSWVDPPAAAASFVKGKGITWPGVGSDTSPEALAKTGIPFYDLDEKGLPKSRPANEMGLSPGDYMMGLKGALYLIVSDPGAGEGFPLHYVEIDPATGTFNGKDYTPGGNGSSPKYKIDPKELHFDLPKGTEAEGDQFDPHDWTSGTKLAFTGEMKKGEKFKVSGVPYEVQQDGSMNNSTVLIKSLDTGQLASINTDYKAPKLILKAGALTGDGVSGPVDDSEADATPGGPPVGDGTASAGVKVGDKAQPAQMPVGTVFQSSGGSAKFQIVDYGGGKQMQPIYDGEEPDPLDALSITPGALYPMHGPTKGQGMTVRALPRAAQTNGPQVGDQVKVLDLPNGAIIAMSGGTEWEVGITVSGTKGLALKKMPGMGDVEDGVFEAPQSPDIEGTVVSLPGHDVYGTPEVKAPKAGDVFAFGGVKHTVTTVLKDGTVKAKPQGESVEAFEPVVAAQLELHTPSEWQTAAVKSTMGSLSVGDLFHGGSGMTPKPYKVTVIGPGNKVSWENVETGQPGHFTKAKFVHKLVPAEPQGAPAPTPSTPVAPSHISATNFDVAAYEQTPGVDVNTLAVGDVFLSAKGTPYKVTKAHKDGVKHVVTQNLLTGKPYPIKEGSTITGLGMPPAKPTVVIPPHESIAPGDVVPLSALKEGDKFVPGDGWGGEYEMLTPGTDEESHLVSGYGTTHPAVALGLQNHDMVTVSELAGGPTQGPVASTAHKATEVGPTLADSSAALDGVQDIASSPGGFKPYKSATSGKANIGAGLLQNPKIATMAPGTHFTDKAGKEFVVKQSGSHAIVSDGQAWYSVDGGLRGQVGHPPQIQDGAGAPAATHFTPDYAPGETTIGSSGAGAGSYVSMGGYDLKVEAVDEDGMFLDHPNGHQVFAANDDVIDGVTPPAAAAAPAGWQKNAAKLNDLDPKPGDTYMVDGLEVTVQSTQSTKGNTYAVVSDGTDSFVMGGHDVPSMVGGTPAPGGATDAVAVGDTFSGKSPGYKAVLGALPVGTRVRVTKKDGTESAFEFHKNATGWQINGVGKQYPLDIGSKSGIAVTHVPGGADAPAEAPSAPPAPDPVPEPPAPTPAVPSAQTPMQKMGLVSADGTEKISTTSAKMPLANLEGVHAQRVAAVTALLPDVPLTAQADFPYSGYTTVYGPDGSLFSMPGYPPAYRLTFQDGASPKFSIGENTFAVESLPKLSYSSPTGESNVGVPSAGEPQPKDVPANMPPAVPIPPGPPTGSTYKVWQAWDKSVKKLADARATAALKAGVLDDPEVQVTKEKLPNGKFRYRRGGKLWLKESGVDYTHVAVHATAEGDGVIITNHKSLPAANKATYHRTSSRIGTRPIADYVPEGAPAPAPAPAPSAAPAPDLPAPSVDTDPAAYLAYTKLAGAQSMDELVERIGQRSTPELKALALVARKEQDYDVLSAIQAEIALRQEFGGFGG